MNFKTAIVFLATLFFAAFASAQSAQPTASPVAVSRNSQVIVSTTVPAVVTSVSQTMVAATSLVPISFSSVIVTSVVTSVSLSPVAATASPTGKSNGASADAPSSALWTALVAGGAVAAAMGAFL